MNIQYRFIEGIYAGIGYLYQNFDYDIKDFRQWYPLGTYTDDTGGTYGPGIGLTYDVKYHIPYLKLGAKGNISDEMQIETSLRYAPMVWAKDRDNHVARQRYSVGDCEGTAWFWSLIARYDFPSRWFMVFEFDYSRITTDGDSKTYSEGVWSHTIDDEIESTQTYFTLTAGYRF
ncbi:MAG: omptin family outer membrane protease [Desulfobacteraceae bacterium]|nr:omptin family outer membrane protease [Desulfobacteraceae bacterium]